MKIGIIGGGPGGLYAAPEAAKNNWTVDLFDEGKIGGGICGGECFFDCLNVMPTPGEGLLHSVGEVILEGIKAYRIHISQLSPAVDD